VENGKHHSHDPPTGAPRVSPDVIKAFAHKSRDFEAAFQKLKRENPELAVEMMRFAEAHSSNLNAKRATMHGALHLYGIIAGNQEVAWLTSLHEQAQTLSDDAAFEDPQPST